MDMIVDRSLINSSFEGYKLAPDTLSLQCLSLPSPVGQVIPDDSNYFFLRLTEDTTVNHLHCLNHDDGSFCFYYIDKELNIQCIVHKESSMVLQTTFSLPKPEVFNSNRVSPTLSVISREFVAASDGIGNLYIIELSQTEEKKEPIRHFNKSKDYIFSLDYPFYIHQVVLKNDTVHFLLLSLHNEQNTDYTKQMFVMIDWLEVQFTKSSMSCFQGGMVCRKFKGYKLPTYVSFSPDLSGLLLAAEQPFVSLDQDGKDSGNQPKRIEEETNTPYWWCQSSELVSVNFNLPASVSKSDVYCHLTTKFMDLYLHGRSLLKGKLTGEVIPDASKWIFDDNRLEVILVKKQAGEHWDTVILGDTRGKHDLEGEGEDKLSELYERLDQLTSEKILTDTRGNQSDFNLEQLEECDRSSDEDTRLVYLSKSNGREAHAMSLAGCQWLFNCASIHSSSLLLCLRHDVDGVLWEPLVTPDSDVVTWKHLTTFNAMGYIQASKREHKYTLCAKDFKFFAICDCNRRIFIYGQESIDAKYGKQYVVTLPQEESILGLQTSSDHVFVLTSNQFFAVRVEL